MYNGEVTVSSYLFVIFLGDRRAPLRAEGETPWAVMTAAAAVESACGITMGSSSAMRMTIASFSGELRSTVPPRPCDRA